MKTAYRFVVFIMIASLFLCVPVVSAAGEEVDSSVYDLLASSSYDRIWDGNVVYSGLSPDRGSTAFVGGAWSVGLRWYHPQSFSRSRCYITIQASVKPYALVFDPYAGATASYCTYVGSSGDYHQYYIDFSGSTAEVTVSGLFADAYYGTYEVISAYVLRSYNSPVTELDYYLNRHQITTTTGYWTYANVYDKKDFQLPGGFFGTYARTSVTRADHVAFTLTINPDDRSVNLADSLEFVLQHFGLMYDVGLQISTYPTSAPHTVLYPSDYDLTQASYPISYGYSAVVYNFVSSFKFDLADIDLDGQYLMLTGKINLENIGINVDGDGNILDRDGWEFRVLNCGFTLPVETPAWYEIFWWRLGNSLADIKSKMSDGFSSVGHWLSSGFSSLGDKLDALITGSPDDNAAADDFGSEVDSQVDSFQSANDSLNSIEKPSVESINSSPEAILDPSGMAMLSQPLNDLLSNKIILGILLITATCALVGYVFFGKR